MNPGENFVQHDAGQAVTDTVVTWLRAHRPLLSGPGGS
jgi:hypothetical protein